MEKGGSREQDDSSLPRLSTRFSFFDDDQGFCRQSQHPSFAVADGPSQSNVAQPRPSVRASQSLDRGLSRNSIRQSTAKHPEGEDVAPSRSWSAGLLTSTPGSTASSDLQNPGVVGQPFRVHALDGTVSSLVPLDRSMTPLSSMQSTPLDLQTRFIRTQSTYSNVAPAHPYSLYQQTAFPEADVRVHAVAPTIHVGFPGRHVNFHRQLGPNGEVLDVVGPDGYSEQLPPYSRYPDQPSPPSEKAPLETAATTVAVTNVATAPSSQSTQNVPSPSQTPSLPSMPSRPGDAIIGMGQPSPLPRSPTMTDVATLDGNRSSSAPSALDEVGENAEKNWNKNSWKEKRRNKLLCGAVPLWAVLIAGSIFLFLAIVAGGVIGGLLSERRGKSKTSSITVTSTAMFDAVRIPPPTDIPPLPTGTFFFPLGLPEEQQRGCLPDTREINAWSCSIPPPPVHVEMEIDKAGIPMARIYPGASMRGSVGVKWGPQPPRVNPMQKMVWVKDVNEPNRGPALHFQTIHDKVVVLQSNELQYLSLDRRESHQGDDFPPPPPPPAPSNGGPPPGGPPPGGPPPGGSPPGGPPPGGPDGPRGHYGGRHRFQVQPGDTPWYCYWNSTFIEGFVYIRQPIPGAETQQYNFTKTSYGSATSAASPSTITFNSELSAGGVTQTVPFATVVTPMANVARYHQPPPPPPPPALNVKAEDEGGDGPPPGPPPPRFPYVVKLEERRLPNPKFPPYCQQMFASPDNSVRPLLDADGKAVITYLKEAPVGKDDAKFTAGASLGDEFDLSRRSPDSYLLPRGQEPSNSCHCQWVSPLQ